MERIDTPYPMSKEDLLLHKDMERITNIGFFCYVENDTLYITHPDFYRDCVNEYWNLKLANGDIKWHTDDKTIRSTIDLSDYLTGLTNEIH